MRSTLLVLDEREHLLELVEDQHELGAVGGQDPLERAQQPPLAILELFDQARRRLVGQPKQRRLELLKWIGARKHFHDLPGLRAGQVLHAAAQGEGRRGPPKTCRSRSARRRRESVIRRAVPRAAPSTPRVRRNRPHPPPQRLAGPCRGYTPQSWGVGIAEGPSARRKARPCARSSSSGRTLITSIGSVSPFRRIGPRSTYLIPSTLRARCATSRLASTSPGPAKLHNRAARLSAPPR